MAYHIRQDDMVEVITGDHAGTRGKVLRVLRKRNMVLVQGVNMVFRHVKPSRKNPQGGRLQKEAPIHMSNVLPVDEKTHHGTRVRFEVQKSGGKVVAKHRVSKGGTRLSELTRRRTEK